MEAPKYTVADFLRDLAPPFNLSYREPQSICKFWVFWSQKGGTETLANNDRRSVQENLKSALCEAENYQRNVPLIQFWAPTTTTTSSSTNGGRTRCMLTTSNQPFGLYLIERGLCEYRKYCSSLEFNIFQDEDEDEDEDEENVYEFGSVIRRVYMSKSQGLTAEASTWSTKYHLLRDFACKCGIQNSLFLPLFKPFSRCCSGVLELVHTSKSDLFSYVYSLGDLISLDANLTDPCHLKSQESTEIEEINKALQGVCETHHLPLAQIWIPCCTITAVAYDDTPGERCHSPCLSCSSKFSSSISQNADEYFYYKSFNHMCKDNDFMKGQGIVGKALLYHKPCFCRDVTQLPMAEYPFSGDAHLLGLTGCCAIWLHSTHTKNHDYVLEFFLPRNTVSGDPQRYLELLLATVKKQLPDFKISSVGEESCVEVCEISVNDDEPDSVIISQPFSVKPVPESFANEKETVQNKVVSETVIDNGSNILGLEQNGIVRHSEKTASEELTVEEATNDEITTRLPPMPESLQNENENEVVLLLSDDEPTIEGVRKNEQTSEAVASSKRIFSRAEASEREYRTTDIALSREDLTKHFGKKLDDAAKILNVSRSTMKRALRHHKIDKWPLPKRKKVVRSGNKGIEGTYKGDPSCSDSPPTPATVGISHKTSNSRHEKDVGNVTIKATHGNKTFRFKLPFLSRKTDLVDKLTMRVSLNEGSFNIQYQDEENEWISIACDEDLEECIGIWKGKSIIKMLVEPITNQAP